MAELNITDVLSEIGLSARAAYKLLGTICVVDDLENLQAIESLVSKIGFLAGAGMGITDDDYRNESDIATCGEWFVRSSQERKGGVV